MFKSFIIQMAYRASLLRYIFVVLLFVLFFLIYEQYDQIMLKNVNDGIMIYSDGLDDNVLLKKLIESTDDQLVEINRLGKLLYVHFVCFCALILSEVLVYYFKLKGILKQ